MTEFTGAGWRQAVNTVTCIKASIDVSAAWSKRGYAVWSRELVSSLKQAWYEGVAMPPVLALQLSHIFMINTSPLSQWLTQDALLPSLVFHLPLKVVIPLFTLWLFNAHSELYCSNVRHCFQYAQYIYIYDCIFTNMHKENLHLHILFIRVRMLFIDAIEYIYVVLTQSVQLWLK